MFRRATGIRKEVCELVANPDETMESFKMEIRKALWHAYDMLDIRKNEQVHISQLKVITSNIGLKLGFEKSEKILDKEGLKSMDYQTYFEAVQDDLLDKVDSSSETTHKPLGEHLNDVIKICWKFCSFKRATNQGTSPLTADHCLKLWRLFNFLAETDDNEKPIFPIQLHREEAAILFTAFIETTGQTNKEQFVTEFADDKSGQTSNLSFSDFQVVFEKNLVQGLTENDITLAINDIYDTYILGVLIKGAMSKRGYQVKNWKERWLTLTSSRLNYYAGQNEKSLKGSIEFDKDCSIEVTPDRPGQKHNMFVLETSKKQYAMSAPDAKTRNKWVYAIQSALDHVGKETSLQQIAAHARCTERREKQRLAEEEERKRQEDADLLRKRQNELDEEKKRCAEAEARLQEEQRLREAEQKRLRELEEIKRELERLLEEEKQAKHDEEIVRTLQARLLEDEFQKREELERLKLLQEEMLRAEREERAGLESGHQEQERALREAQLKLEQLERDKAATAERMQEAATKLQKAENDRRIMEKKVKLWKTPGAVGLKRLISPHVEVFPSHRGEGAFPKDYLKKRPDEYEKSKSPEPIRKARSDENQDIVLEDKLSTSIGQSENGGNSGDIEETNSLPESNISDEMAKQSNVHVTHDPSQTSTNTVNNDLESNKHWSTETDNATESELAGVYNPQTNTESTYQTPDHSITEPKSSEEPDPESQDVYDYVDTTTHSPQLEDITDDTCDTANSLTVEQEPINTTVEQNIDEDDTIYKTVVSNEKLIDDSDPESQDIYEYVDTTKHSKQPDDVTDDTAEKATSVTVEQEPINTTLEQNLEEHDTIYKTVVSNEKLIDDPESQDVYDYVDTTKHSNNWRT